MICFDNRFCTLFCIIMIPETLSIDGASELFVFAMDIFLLVYFYGIIVIIIIIHVPKNLHTFDEEIPSFNNRETN
jgi:hypothetical protein